MPENATVSSDSQPVFKAGSTDSLDPRIHAYRPDLADIALATCVAAPRYATPVALVCAVNGAMIVAKPEADATAVSQLLFGERFAVLDMMDGYAWGFCETDHYVGYIRQEALTPLDQTPSHWVCAASTHVYAGPSLKSVATHVLTLGARVPIAGDRQGDYWPLSTGGYVHNRAIQPLGTWETDPVPVAERFIGIPYLWGGRGVTGIDCSGLVQVALGACGVDAPRDTDMQRALGSAVIDQPLQRGDLVCFPGHIGWMVDATQLLHANAYWMRTIVEPLDDVVARLKPHVPEPILTVRRMTGV